MGLSFRAVASDPIPGGWGKMMTIQLEAKRDKGSGKPWDASDLTVIPPGLHNIFFPLTAPAPDLFLCIVDEDGQSQCQYSENRNAVGVPISLCPNEFKCVLESIPVPSGYFGVLVGDLDAFRQNDFVAAGVFYSGKKDARRAYKVEQQMHALVKKWSVPDAPSEFPVIDMDACVMDSPCAPKGGAGWIGFSENKPEECGFDLTYSLEAKPHGSSADLVATDLVSQCQGKTEYFWTFGDGAAQTTTQGRVSHEYMRPGDYKASVTVRCRRQFSVCQGQEVRETLSIQ
jgi:hypothetical protein